MKKIIATISLTSVALAMLALVIIRVSVSRMYHDEESWTRMARIHIGVDSSMRVNDDSIDSRAVISNSRIHFVDQPSPALVYFDSLGLVEASEKESRPSGFGWGNFTVNGEEYDGGVARYRDSSEVVIDVAQKLNADGTLNVRVRSSLDVYVYDSYLVGNEESEGTYSGSFRFLPAGDHRLRVEVSESGDDTTQLPRSGR